MSFVQLFTGSLIQLFLYTVKKTSCHCMQSCLSPHPSIEIFIYQRIYLKYSYLETFPGGAPLRVTYAEPKPPSWPTACPPFASSDISNRCTCSPLHRQPPLLNQLLPNQKSHGMFSSWRESPMPSIPETCHRPINEFLARAAPEDGAFPGRDPSSPQALALAPP